MRIISNKRLRRTVNAALSIAPHKYRVAADRWLRGRQEFQKLQAADFVIVSLGKSGRTWLRTMISRYYQVKYNLPEGSILGFDNFHKMNPLIPKVFFTHDHCLKYYTGNADSKLDYYGKKIILLVRDPRDVAVSNYFQRKYRASELSKKLYTDMGDNVALYEYVSRFSIPRGVDFLNAWAREMPHFEKFLSVRYEDLRENTEQHLAPVLDFLGLQASGDEIREIISYARFENMKKREQGEGFRTEGRRLFGGDQKIPDSFKVRRGKIGGYKDYFSEDEIVSIDRLVQDGLAPVYKYSKA